MRTRHALALSLLFVGCYDPSSSPRSNFRGLGEPAPTPTITTPVGPTRPGSSPSPAVSPVQPGATFEGSLGAVQDFSSNAVEIRFERDAVQIDAVNPSAGWWVMTHMTFSRPLSDPAWEMGRVYTFDVGRAPNGPLSVSALSCSGPSRGHYTYDSSTFRMTMHIEPGSTPGARLVTFAQYWIEAPHVVTGSFEYLPR